MGSNSNGKIKSSVFMMMGFFLIITSGCKKDVETPVQETGTVTDIEGHVYKTVKIGKQWWMAENLRVTKYRDSSSILTILPSANDSAWNDTVGLYCIYDNNSDNIKYGFLYNWYAVQNVKNIAPAGWHVPSDEEWKELEKHLGMSQPEADKINWRGTHEGEKLKIEGPKGWTKYSTVWGTNESGFTALAGGCRIFNGAWGNPGLFSTGFWWSATEYGSAAWYRYLDYKNTNVFRNHTSKNYGFSIRCVKD